MSRDPLDRAVRDHYRRQAPGDRVLGRLRDATAAADRGRSRRRWPLLGAVAMLALAVALAWLTFGRVAPDSTVSDGISPEPIPSNGAAAETARRSFARRVAVEVSMNHRKELEPDFMAERYAVLASAMDKLDFLLAPPDPARLSGLDPRGARYCSIQGSLAAQLQLVSPTERRATLYQTRLDPALEALGERIVDETGVRVTMWSEGGVFFALAEDPPDGG